MRNTSGIDENSVLLGFACIFAYFIMICCCLVVGPRAMCRSVLVKEASWPEVDEAPCLNLFGWGIGGPFTARCLCEAAVMTEETV